MFLRIWDSCGNEDAHGGRVGYGAAWTSKMEAVCSSKSPNAITASPTLIFAICVPPSD